MTSLVFAHNAVLTVDGDTTIDTSAVSALPAIKDTVDIAVEGFANWISGDYKQKSSATNDIQSNVTVGHLK